MQNDKTHAPPEAATAPADCGYRLLTAEIVFSEGEGAQEAITWRDYDATPGFPRLRAFIDRWRDDPELRVRSVTVTDIADVVVPACRILPASKALH